MSECDFPSPKESAEKPLGPRPVGSKGYSEGLLPCTLGKGVFVADVPGMDTERPYFRRPDCNSGDPKKMCTVDPRIPCTKELVDNRVASSDWHFPVTLVSEANAEADPALTSRDLMASFAHQTSPERFPPFDELFDAVCENCRGDARHVLEVSTNATATDG